MIRVKVGGEWGVDGLGIVYIEVGGPQVGDESLGR